MISLMINDSQLASELIAERQAKQLDRYDEVWEGVYMMSPLASNEHQSLATELAIAIGTTVDWQHLGRTLLGANVTDRRDDWTQNYRIPDVLVFAKQTSAEDRGTHWLGGPEFAIEIVSPGDRTLDKLEFYAKVGTRELLVIDRDPWQLTLYRINTHQQLVPVGVCQLKHATLIELREFPIAFSLSAATSTLEVLRADGTPVRGIPIRV